MKKINIILALLILIGSSAIAQTPYNPFTQNIHFIPEPTVQGYECGAEPSVAFTCGMTTAADATNLNSPLSITICIGGFEFRGPASTAVTGSYASNFDWEYDSFAPNCVIGIQKQILPGTGSNPLNPNPLASGDIVVALKVPTTAPIASVLSVNVNLQVPGYMQAFNSQPDDNESTTTQTYCALKVSGHVHYDTTINNKVDGELIQKASDTILYATLIGPGGDVQAVTPIDANGYYEFTGININTSYQVFLSVYPGVIGQPPPVIELPFGWTNVGEDCCDRLGTDGIDDGKIAISVTNFSKEYVDFGIYTPPPTGSLPTTVKNFYVTEYKCSGILTWTTAQEINTSHVEILRKDNPNGTFNKIAVLPLAGNSSTTLSYSYIDKTVTQQDNYYEYKLKFVDIDQKSTLSEVRSLKMNCGDASSSTLFNIFPNPATTELNVVYITDEADMILQLDIVDLAGRKILSKAQEIVTGSNVISLDIHSVATGNYFIKYHIAENGTSGSLKFLKN